MCLDRASVPLKFQANRVRFHACLTLCSWCHGEASLIRFLQYMNKLHTTIKFEYEYSTKTVHFLYTRIYVNGQNKLESDVYIKPTDKTMLLHNTSFHANTCKQGVIYSQALRYRRIITDDNILRNQLEKLKIILMTRGYKTDTIDNAFGKATQHTQKQLLYCQVSTTTK